MFLLLSHLAPHTGNRYEPFQVPKEEMEKFAFIKDIDRRKYAAMVSLVDASVGLVVESLRVRNMLENSVILFFSDNGGPTITEMRNTASNHPFRGVSNILIIFFPQTIKIYFSKKIHHSKVVSERQQQFGVLC